MSLDPQLIKAFKKKYGLPGAQFIPFPKRNPTALYHQIFKTADDSMSVMAVLIEKVNPHIHKDTTEHHLVVKGELDLLRIIGGVTNTHVMRPGDSTAIRADVIHRSQSLNGGTELIVISIPAWRPGNHHPKRIKIEPWKPTKYFPDNPTT